MNDNKVHCIIEYSMIIDVTTDHMHGYKLLTSV